MKNTKRGDALHRYYRIQSEIASKAVLKDCTDINRISLVAGADQAFFREEDSEKIVSAVVVMKYPSFDVVEHAFSIMHVEFPYIPGLLAFREAPAIISAFNRLKWKPDVLFVDGCGINHPRFAGLATHVGVVLNIPTVGVAKNLLCGKGEVPERVGEASEIVFKGTVVGYFLKSKKNCKPIIVAPGNKISVKTSVELTRRCIRRHKLPEPTRMAHVFANKIKKQHIATKK